MFEDASGPRVCESIDILILETVDVASRVPPVPNSVERPLFHKDDLAGTGHSDDAVMKILVLTVYKDGSVSRGTDSIDILIPVTRDIASGERN